MVIGGITFAVWMQTYRAYSVGRTYLRSSMSYVKSDAYEGGFVARPMN
jgi:hypothetical protein